MPRIGRKRLASRWEDRENEARAEELRELAAELRRQWRRRHVVAERPDTEAEATEPQAGG